MKLFKTRIALAVGLLSTGSFALGATSSDTMGVTATVVDSCNVAATALGLGDYDPIAGTDLDTTTTIDVTCSNGTTYDIGLDAGTTAGATVSARQLSHATAGTLNYALYSDSGRSTNWGDTVASDTVAGTGDGTAQTNTVYGRVPSGQNAVPIGAYTDTINVTVTY